MTKSKFFFFSSIKGVYNNDHLQKSNGTTTEKWWAVQYFVRKSWCFYAIHVCRWWKLKPFMTFRWHFFFTILEVKTEKSQKDSKSVGSIAFEKSIKNSISSRNLKEILVHSELNMHCRYEWRRSSSPVPLLESTFQCPGNDFSTRCQWQQPHP